jgi:hypothetical protein
MRLLGAQEDKHKTSGVQGQTDAKRKAGIAPA